MENKYIEAFENIIFQKRDNGYISDAYRNDISVVYEALNKLEKLKNEEAELINNNKNKEYIQNDIELTNKLVEETKECEMVNILQALKNGIYIKSMPSGKIKQFKVRLSYVNNEWFFTSMQNDMCVDVKSYKKNWWLNSEVLENE